MNSQSTPLNHAALHQAAPYTQGSACLARNSVQAFPELAGETLRCTSGQLWVTLENDGNDHILKAGDSLGIPATGKVVISGPGCYQITGDRKELRRAS